MWRKIFAEIKYHHLLSIFAFLSFILVAAGVTLYWQSDYLGENSVLLLLLLLLVAIFILGIFLVFFTHVAHRDGFLDGYHNGRKDGYENGKKDGQKSKD